jgi:putative methyltransferase
VQKIYIYIFVIAINSSFLDTLPLSEQFKDVEYVLLDPSCSGSGIVGRFDELVDQLQSDPTGKQRNKQTKW